MSPFSSTWPPPCSSPWSYFSSISPPPTPCPARYRSSNGLRPRASRSCTGQSGGVARCHEHCCPCPAPAAHAPRPPRPPPPTRPPPIPHSLPRRHGVRKPPRSSRRGGVVYLVSERNVGRRQHAEGTRRMGVRVQLIASSKPSELFSELVRQLAAWRPVGAIPAQRGVPGVAPVPRPLEGGLSHRGRTVGTGDGR